MMCDIGNMSQAAVHCDPLHDIKMSITLSNLHNRIMNLISILEYECVINMSIIADVCVLLCLRPCVTMRILCIE